MPFQGLRLPVKSCGNLMGNITASFRLSFAWYRPATSSQRTLGFSLRAVRQNDARSAAVSSGGE